MFYTNLEEGDVAKIGTRNGEYEKWEHRLGNVFNDRVRVLSGCQDGLLGCDSFPCIGRVFFFKDSFLV